MFESLISITSLLTLIILCSATVQASEAVKATSHVVSASYSANYGYLEAVSSSRSSSAEQFQYQFTFPLSAYLGSTFQFDSTNTDDKSVAGLILDKKELGASYGLFMRYQNMGLLGFNIGYAEAELDPSFILDSNSNFNADITNFVYIPSSYQNKSKIDAMSYSIGGEYYAHKMTGFFHRSILDLSDLMPVYGLNKKKRNASAIGLRFYPTRNAEISIASWFMDEDDRKSFQTTYQPKLFNNTTAFSFVYEKVLEIEMYSISVSYYFDNRVSLYNRDRYY